MEDSLDPVLLDLELKKLECQIQQNIAEIQSQTIVNNSLEKTIEKEKNDLCATKEDLARLQLLNFLELERFEAMKTKLETYENDQAPRTKDSVPSEPVNSEMDELELQLAQKREELEQLRANVESQKMELLISKNRANAKIRRSQIVLAAEKEKCYAAEQKLMELKGKLAEFRF